MEFDSDIFYWNENKEKPKTSKTMKAHKYLLVFLPMKDLLNIPLKFSCNDREA
jgi:hypothetical protein